MPLWSTGREPQGILAALKVHLETTLWETLKHHANQPGNGFSLVIEEAQIHRCLEITLSSASSSFKCLECPVTDLPGETGASLCLWSQGQLQLWAPLKKLLRVNKPLRVYLRSRRGAKSAPEKNYLCLSRRSQEWRKHPEKAMEIQTTEEEGHLWSSPGPLGASKEMSWLLLPTFLPLPHQPLFLAALSESWE